MTDSADSAVSAATNAELAERARQFAIEGGSDRPAWLCVAVAIATTKTTASARKVLADWDGPAVVRDRAVELLNQMEGR